MLLNLEQQQKWWKKSNKAVNRVIKWNILHMTQKGSKKEKILNVDWTNRKQISAISIIKFIVSGLNHSN